MVLPIVTIDIFLPEYHTLNVFLSVEDSVVFFRVLLLTPRGFQKSQDQYKGFHS